MRPSGLGRLPARGGAAAGRCWRCAAAAGAAGRPAWAGLFDDDEARKAILDLRAASAGDEQSQGAHRRAGGANAQLHRADAALRRSLLDLNNQLELLRGEWPSCAAPTSNCSASWPTCRSARRTWARRWTSGCASSSR
jgi:hypothetical protein